VRHHRPRADHGTGTDPHAPEDHGARAKARAVLDRRAQHRPVGFGLQPACRGGRGPLVVDEDHTMADEHTLTDRDAVADERMALDLAARTDDRTALNLDEGADSRLLADAAAIQVGESVNEDVRPEVHIADQAVRRVVDRCVHALTKPAAQVVA
jgi:hypothetical protein